MYRFLPSRLNCVGNSNTFSYLCTSGIKLLKNLKVYEIIEESNLKNCDTKLHNNINKANVNTFHANISFLHRLKTTTNQMFEMFELGSFIWYVRKIFRRTDILRARNILNEWSRIGLKWVKQEFKISPYATHSKPSSFHQHFLATISRC